MTKIRFVKLALIIAAFCLAAIAAQAQTFTVIKNLEAPLEYIIQFVQGTDGNLLGNDQAAGVDGQIIQMSVSGRLTKIYKFCAQTNCADGEFPMGIYQAANGTIYGGTNGNGALYQITGQGKEAVLYNFCSQANCTDGWGPFAAPAPSVNGGMLGETFGGGAAGKGILFEVTSTGKFTPLYSFCAQTNCTDGSGPVTSPIQTADGTIYGTTNLGGENGAGTFFSFSSKGLMTLYSFPSAENGFTSAEPTLIQGADGNFYGVTRARGTAGMGSVFEITPQGKFTTLYSFCTAGNCTDGAYPIGLIQGSDGNFYGMTSDSGPLGGGTVFQLTPQGVLITLQSFCDGCSQGNGPQSLVQDTNGTFYGTTAAGGMIGKGTVFSLSMGLGPFVRSNPGWGKVGGTVGILGNNLT